MLEYAKPEGKQKEKAKDPVQKSSAANQTGIPDVLKAQFEGLSGFSFDDVRVHYNSDKPAQLRALAYTQGNQVYVAPGQEKQLGHELGHVVQQKEGRVCQTMQLRGLNINTDKGLEAEASAMGERALAQNISQSNVLQFKTQNSDVLQFSFGDWLKRSAVSFGSLVLGSAVRVPKRLIELGEHIVIDLALSIYYACKSPDMDGKAGLMSEQASLLHWGLGLLTKTLDVMQIREIMAFLAILLGGPCSKSRGLSDEEKAFAEQIFGSSMNLFDVTVFENSAITGPTAGQGNAFTAAHTIHADDSFETEERQAILMHELVHIAQEQKQGILSWIELEWGRRKTRAIAATLGVADADYYYGPIAPDSAFRDYSREQQGAIVQDYAEYIQAHGEVDGMINSTRGGGTFADYHRMLAGLSKGHWLLPFKSSEWKKTLG